ncbi:hypothetical protein D3C75_921470 [compost metagenome]
MNRILLYLLSIFLFVLVGGLCKGTILGIIFKIIVFFLIGIPIVVFIGKLVINLIYFLNPEWSYGLEIDIKNFWKKKQKKKRL